MTSLLPRPWVRVALLGLAVLVALSPLFGWASGAVGYAEPLDNAAESTGADAAERESASLLSGYSAPGLDRHTGTLASAFGGTALTLVVAVGVGRLLER